MQALKNWKTTVTAVVVLAVTLAGQAGIEVPETVSDGVIAIALFVIGFFALESTKQTAENSE